MNVWVNNKKMPVHHGVGFWGAILEFCLPHNELSKFWSLLMREMKVKFIGDFSYYACKSFHIFKIHLQFFVFFWWMMSAYILYPYFYWVLGLLLFFIRRVLYMLRIFPTLMTLFVLFILPGTSLSSLLPPETPFILYSPGQTHTAQWAVPDHTNAHLSAPLYPFLVLFHAYVCWLLLAS